MSTDTIPAQQKEKAQSLAGHAAPLPYKPVNKVRIVTAASLFDGHDAAINIMRRIIQSTGVEVIHLGHDRSVEEIVEAAVQEDAHAVAISSYQGGHLEFFRFLIDRLREADGLRVGMLALQMYRPFPHALLAEALQPLMRHVAPELDIPSNRPVAYRHL